MPRVAALLAVALIEGAGALTSGHFALQTLDGREVTDSTYRGKWLLVFFGYTSCPNICPTTLLGVADALKQLGSDASQLQPLFISIDPVRDTPDVMAAYVRSFDPRIIGLTGSESQIAGAAKEYGAYYTPH